MYMQIGQPQSMLRPLVLQGIPVVIFPCMVGGISAGRRKGRPLPAGATHFLNNSTSGIVTVPVGSSVRYSIRVRVTTVSDLYEIRITGQSGSEVDTLQSPLKLNVSNKNPNIIETLAPPLRQWTKARTLISSLLASLLPAF